MADLAGWLRRSLSGAEERSALRAPSPELKRAFGVGEFGDGGMSVEKALRYADVYACIRVLADSVGATPLIVYRRGRGGRVRAPESLVAGTLRHPSPSDTQSSFMSTLMAHLAGWGNAYVAKYRTVRGGPVVLLVPVHPGRVSVGRDESFEPRYVIDGDVANEYNRRDILHIKAMSTDGVVGMSPIGQARDAISVGADLEAQASAFLRNSSNPSGVLQVKGKLSPEAAERLRGQWETTHRGARSVGRTAVLEEGTTWQATSIPSRDAQFVEQRKLSSTQIARIFRVPPYLIGADSGSSMTYSNVEQENLQLVTHTLRPWLVTIEQALHADEDLFSRGGDLYPEFLIDAFLRSDTLTRYQAYRVATGAPWMTPNEARERENLTRHDNDHANELGRGTGPAVGAVDQGV